MANIETTTNEESVSFQVEVKISPWKDGSYWANFDFPSVTEGVCLSIFDVAMDAHGKDNVRIVKTTKKSVVTTEVIE